MPIIEFDTPAPAPAPTPAPAPAPTPAPPPVDKDEIYRLAFEGDAGAQHALSKFLSVNGDASESAKWLYRSAKGGCQAARLACKERAEQGDDAARCAYALLCTDNSAAGYIGSLREQAEQGNCTAQYFYGLYRKPISGKDAVKWFLKAYKQGDLDAGLEVAAHHTKKNKMKEAKQIIEQALQAGIPGAQEAAASFNNAVDVHNKQVDASNRAIDLWNTIRAIIAIIAIIVWLYCKFH